MLVRLFHMLTTLSEKKCWRRSLLHRFFFNFHWCPLVTPLLSNTKNVSGLMDDTPLTILKTSIRSARTFLSSRVHRFSSLSQHFQHSFADWFSRKLSAGFSSVHTVSAEQGLTNLGTIISEEQILLVLFDIFSALLSVAINHQKSIAKQWKVKKKRSNGQRPDIRVEHRTPTSVNSALCLVSASTSY